LLIGWANYFILGQVSPAYRVVDLHVQRRLRWWLRNKHKVQGRGNARFPYRYLCGELGLTELALRVRSFPWAKASIPRHTSTLPPFDRVRAGGAGSIRIAAIRRAEQLDIVREVSARLERAGSGYILAGSLAMDSYGQPPTSDRRKELREQHVHGFARETQRHRSFLRAGTENPRLQ